VFASEYPLHSTCGRIDITGNVKTHQQKRKISLPGRYAERNIPWEITGKNQKTSAQRKKLYHYRQPLDELWSKPWVVFCEPPMTGPVQIVKYLAGYTHRAAISNQLILEIIDNHVVFSYKDYGDNGSRKTIRLTCVEFLRRFCLHILPYRFVKIRYYGIMSSKMKILLQSKRLQHRSAEESSLQRLKRLTGFDAQQRPFCKTGRMHRVERLPRIRSPDHTIYQTREYETC